VVSVVVGFALLLNPPVVDALELNDPDSFRYESAEVSFHDDGAVDVPHGVETVDPDVVCLNLFPRRTCMLERAIHENGGLRYDGVPSHFLDTQYEYVHVYGEGFFEPVAEEVRGDVVNYSLERVSSEEALSDVAIDTSRASEGVRAAVTSGHYTTSDRLPGANELVRHEGSYYVVHLAGGHWGPNERAPFVVTLQWIAGIGGAWLILRGQRLRVTEA
jgi:hypothetical protein